MGWTALDARRLGLETSVIDDACRGIDAPTVPGGTLSLASADMIAAGVNAKALCVYMGHSSVTVTFDLYGHLMPGNEAEAATLLDAYLESNAQPA